MAYLPVQAFAAVWKFVTNRRGKGRKKAQNSLMFSLLSGNFLPHGVTRPQKSMASLAAAPLTGAGAGGGGTVPASRKRLTIG